MSNQVTSEANQTSKPAPKVVNPYAKKKSTTTNGGGTKNGTAQSKQGTATNALKPVEIGVSATFSQAFASLEDTSHFQGEQANMKQRAGGVVANSMDETSWAAQRAFDEILAGEAEKSGPLTDRDHHELMQPHVLYVSTKQRGNGLLNHIRNVPIVFSQMVPDYLMSTSRCALFLSCKYHNLYPNYIHRRIAELRMDFVLRVLLVLVDVEDNASTLLFLNKLAVINNMTLILAWSEEEAARYLETYKAFDGKDASSIQRREQTNFVDQAADVLTAARGVNKTDSAQLLSQFSSLRAITAASMDELGLCSGMGDVKVKALHDALHKPFSTRRANQRKEAKEIARRRDNDAKDEEPVETEEFEFDSQEMADENMGNVMGMNEQNTTV